MDLSKLNVTAASDKAKRLPILDPFSGQVLVDEDGTEMALWAVSHRSTRARNKRAEQIKELPPMPDGDDPEALKEWQAEAEAMGKRQLPELLAALVTDIEGKWEYHGKPVTPGSDAIVELIRNDPDEGNFIARPLEAMVANLDNYRPKM